MQITNISEAKANLSYLIKTVQETNETIIIGKAGQPVATLSAYKKDKSPRQLGGSWVGRVKLSADFDKVDAEISDTFYDSSIYPDNVREKA